MSVIQFSLVFILTLSSAFAVDWQGHRGARGLYPENTIGAMEEALKYPVTTLELDVVVTKDNQILVSHEPWMSEEICTTPEGKPVKDQEYNIYQMTAEEVQKFDCGSKVHPRFPQQKKVKTVKPLLVDLLNEIEPKLKKLNKSKIGYNIEIKSTEEDEAKGFQPNYRTFSDMVVKTIKSKLALTKFTIQSFDWRVLSYIHINYPEVRLVALIEEPFEPIKVIKKLGFYPYVFSPNYENLKAAYVDAFHAMNVKVVPWTVNDASQMEAMIAMKVDGIITDYPNLIQEVVSKTCINGTIYFDGKCVTVPANAVPSGEKPGWKCKEGFRMKRMKSCEKPGKSKGLFSSRTEKQTKKETSSQGK